MKKYAINAAVCVIALVLFGCGNTQAQPTEAIPVIENPTVILNTVYNGTELDACVPELRTYLSAQTEAEQIEALQENSGFDSAYQSFAFDWESDGSEVYTVSFADNPRFENAWTCQTEKTKLTDYGFFVPGTTYYWKVEGNLENSTSQIDWFTVLDAPARVIGTEAIINLRDIGGWKTQDGQKVRYGMIYRCGRTNMKENEVYSEADADLIAKTLGVVTEIDLRLGDAHGQSKSVLGDNVGYLKLPIAAYSCILPQFSQDEPVVTGFDPRSVDSIREIFTVLGREETYPLVFHCNAGADRTGTLAFLINGVLGVSYEDLTRDYEITSFAGGNIRWRSDITEENTFADYGIMLEDDANYIAWGQLYTLMMEHYATQDGTLQSAIENYLVNACQVRQEDITFLKNMMLEKGE